jgi:multicomponent Na+:H+ antiporter subunit D
MNALLTAPILIPLFSAALSLLAWRHVRVQRSIAGAGACGLLANALLLLARVQRDGIMAIQVGSWPAPFGITLVADLFSAIMLVLAALMGLAVVIYSFGSIDRRREAYGYYIFYHLLLMGVCGVFVTGDFFNMYVWFEVMLMSSFVLLAIGGEKRQLEGAIKYVTLNLVSSAFFLTALGILYGMAGTLNMADLHGRLAELGSPALVTTLAMLFLVAFGIKAAMFPLFFWLPASYHTPPVSVSAIFAGLLTKVGVYTLIRVFTLLFTQDVGYTHTIIVWLSGFTMLTGVLGAMANDEIRRILSFHIISQVGYMTMGLGLYSPLALAGSIFYIMHHIIVKTNLFLVSGVTFKTAGSYRLEHLGGLSLTAPALTCIFAVSAFSLAGIPPLSGFWAKFILIKSGLAQQAYGISAVALVVGLLTLFSMTKIWAAAFWRRSPRPLKPLSLTQKSVLYAPMISLAVLTVTIGLAAGAFFDLAGHAARQLLEPAAYVQAVLGAAR